MRLHIKLCYVCWRNLLKPKPKVGTESVGLMIYSKLIGMETKVIFETKLGNGRLGSLFSPNRLGFINIYLNARFYKQIWNGWKATVNKIIRHFHWSRTYHPKFRESHFSQIWAWYPVTTVDSSRTRGNSR